MTQKQYHQNNDQANLMLGVDFNITYAKRGDKGVWNTTSETTLKEGENWISGYLKVMLDVSYSPDEVSYGHNNTNYRITHQSYGRGSPIQPTDFAIKYKFKNQKISSIVSKIYMGVSTRNNSFCGHDIKPYDGAWGIASAKPGELNFLLITPKKILYSSIEQ